jgi:hypothetical protein
MKDFKDQTLRVYMRIKDRDPRCEGKRIGTILAIGDTHLTVSWNTNVTSRVKRDGISKRFELLPEF